MTAKGPEFKRVCQSCGQVFLVKAPDIRKAINRGSPDAPRFCSHPCRHEGMRGAGGIKWAGGKARDKGYVLVYAPDHPYATARGYVREHRLVMEALIGRLLRPEEVVHHVNHVRDDNRPENLILIQSNSEHRILHSHYANRPCAECGVTVVRSITRRKRSTRSFCSRRCVARFNVRKINQTRAEAS